VRTVAGLGFAVTFVGGALVYGSGAGRTAAEISAYYADPSHRARQLSGFAIVLVASLLLVVFVSTLRSRLAVLSGGVTAGLLIGANALWAASALVVELEPDYRIDPRTHLLVEDAGFGLFISAAAAAIPLVAAVSMRSSAPSWFRWAGVPVAAALAASFLYIPFFVFVGWIVAAAVLSLGDTPEEYAF
jgi:hypothetical protein